MKVDQTRQSVRWVIFLILGLFMLISLLFGAAVISAFLNTIESEIWNERRSDAALNASNIIDTFVQRELELMTFTAENMRGPQAQDNTDLEFLFNNEPVFYELVQVDRTGAILYAVSSGSENLTSTFAIRQSYWFQQLKKGDTFIGSVEYSSSGEPYVILAISSSSGNIIAARVNMSVLRDVVREIRMGNSGQVYIVDTEGYLIAHPNPALMKDYTNISSYPNMAGALTFTGNSWSGNYRNLQGVMVMGTAVRAPITHWTVIAEVNRLEVHQFSRLAWIAQFILVGLFSTAATFISRHYLTRRVFGPLNELRNSANEIQKGNLDIRIPISHQDEIGDVANSFNQMALSLNEHQQKLEDQSEELRKEVAERLLAQQALEQLNSELEERVQLRTAELSELNNLLQESESKFHSLVENIPAVVYIAILHTEGPNLIYVSPQIGDLLGYSPSEWMEDGHWSSQIDPTDYPIVAEYYAQMHQSADRYMLEYRLRTTKGTYVWIKDQGIVKENVTMGRYILGVMSDITLEREANAHFVHLALHDPLTSLPNRTLLVERLDHIMRRAHRHPEIRYAVLYLDLDRFKLVNDMYGHAAGDEILIETGARIQAMVRELDTVARFGGDEFVILVEDPKDKPSLFLMMERIREEIRKPFYIKGIEIRLEVSIGMAFCDEECDNPIDMINAADLSMYREKMSGRQTREIF